MGAPIRAGLQGDTGIRLTRLEPSTFCPSHRAPLSGSAGQKWRFAGTLKRLKRLELSTFCMARSSRRLFRSPFLPGDRHFPECREDVVVSVFIGASRRGFCIESVPRSSPQRGGWSPTPEASRPSASRLRSQGSSLRPRAPEEASLRGYKRRQMALQRRLPAASANVDVAGLGLLTGDLGTKSNSNASTGPKQNSDLRQLDREALRRLVIHRDDEPASR
jgi:hypothetical protein